MSTEGYLQRWSDVIFLSASEFWRAVATFLPNVIGAIILLIVGLYIARLFRRLVEEALEVSWVKKATKVSKVSDVLKTAGLETEVSHLFAGLAYWVVIAIFVLAISEVLGLQVVVATLNELIAYIPNVLAAVIVLVLSFAAAKVVRDAVVTGLDQMGMVHHEAIGRLAGGVLILFGALVATSQLGFDIAVITANITLIVAGVVATGVLAIGLGARDVVANLIAGYYTKRWFEKGQKVQLVGLRGTVKEVTDVAVVLESADEQVEMIVPNKDVVERGSRE